MGHETTTFCEEVAAKTSLATSRVPSPVLEQVVELLLSHPGQSEDSQVYVALIENLPVLRGVANVSQEERTRRVWVIALIEVDGAPIEVTRQAVVGGIVEET